MLLLGRYLRSTGGYSVSLIFDDFAWRDMYCLVEPLSGELRYLVVFFSRTYLDTLVDKAIRSFGQLIIAPVSEVGEEDL